MFFNILPATLQYLLASCLWKTPNVSPLTSSVKFELRHVHGLVTNTTRVVFNDVAQSSFAPETYEVQTRLTKVSKARSQSDFSSARFGHIEPMWDNLEVEGPNVHDRETLQLLANMSNNAYYEDRANIEWYDLGPEWNTVSPYLRYSTAFGQLMSTSCARATPLDGSPMQMGSVDISLRTRTTPPSSSLSKEPQPAGLSVAADLRLIKTSLTTIYSFLAAADALDGRGLLYVHVTRAAISAISSV